MAASKPKKQNPSKISSPPPFETASLRKGLHAFSKLRYPDETSEHNVGWFKWGVYIFYDYDQEPIYVGQTNEKVSGRISRHLTNQRTDAVAMSVLDPFEVFEIEVYRFRNIRMSTANIQISRMPNCTWMNTLFTKRQLQKANSRRS
jgi:hypothetical protein